MEPLVVRPNRWLFGALFLVSGFFVAGGLWLATTSNTVDEQLPGILLVLLFGAILLFSGWYLLRAKPRIVLNDAGVEDFNLRMGVIPWSEITAAYVVPYLFYKNVQLQVRNPQLFRQRQPGWMRGLSSYNEAFGMSPFTLQMSSTNSNAQTVLDYINRQLLRQLGTAPAPPPAAARPVAGPEEGEY